MAVQGRLAHSQNLWNASQSLEKIKSQMESISEVGESYNKRIQELNRRLEGITQEYERLTRHLTDLSDLRNKSSEALREFLCQNIDGKYGKLNADSTKLILRLQNLESQTIMCDISIPDGVKALLLKVTVKDAWLVLYPYALPAEELCLTTADGEIRPSTEVAWNGHDPVLYYTIRKLHNETLLCAKRAIDEKYSNVTRYPAVIGVSLSLWGFGSNPRGATVSVALDESSPRVNETERIIEPFYVEDCFCVPVSVVKKNFKVLRIL